MNDLTKAAVSTLLCALLGMAVAESSIAPQMLSSTEHHSPGDTAPQSSPWA